MVVRTTALARAVASTALATSLVAPAVGSLDAGERATPGGPAPRQLARVAHADPVPPGSATGTGVDELFAAAELDAGTSAADVVSGPSRVPGLARHVAPSCSGTGTDGNRVQVLYAREQGTPSRYAAVLPVLADAVATVDDVLALSARKTGGGLRVRWVHEACTPTITEVVLPDGALRNAVSVPTQALRNAGYGRSDRKYLVFTDLPDSAGCGWGTILADSDPVGNDNDGRYSAHSRIDPRCWSSSTGRSIPAHELTHMLGAVQRDTSRSVGAPHSTPGWHCTDESDLMCYADGDGVTMTRVCPSEQEALLDCGDDDYLHTSPPAGSYVAQHWNIANSSFLDRVAPLSAGPDVSLRAEPHGADGQVFLVHGVGDQGVGWEFAEHPQCVSTAVDGDTMRYSCRASLGSAIRFRATASGQDGASTDATADMPVDRSAVWVAGPRSLVSGRVELFTARTSGAPATFAWSLPAGCTGLPTSGGREIAVRCGLEAVGSERTVTATIEGRSTAESRDTTVVSVQRPAAVRVRGTTAAEPGQRITLRLRVTDGEPSSTRWRVPSSFELIRTTTTRVVLRAPRVPGRHRVTVRVVTSDGQLVRDRHRLRVR